MHAFHYDAEGGTSGTSILLTLNLRLTFGGNARKVSTIKSATPALYPLEITYAMLTCHACRKRFLHIFTRGFALSSSSLKSSVATNHNRQTIGRNYGSISTNYASSEAESPHKGMSDWVPAATDVVRQYSSSNEVFPASINRKQWLESRGVRPKGKSQLKPKSKFVIDKELSYLKDPLKLAEFVRKSLRDDDFEGAEAIVRAASKDVLCTVSWNHLIDWQLSKGRMNAAIKTFNEVFGSYLEQMVD